MALGSSGEQIIYGDDSTQLNDQKTHREVIATCGNLRSKMHDSFVAERNVPREPLLAFTQGEQSKECPNVEDSFDLCCVRWCWRTWRGGSILHVTFPSIRQRERLGRYALQRCVRPS